ncbi:MAG TPA: sugar phosphate isomerase/epimerase [Planctomycetaceae bacterium]|nr:sugar phosphate isomerase/epimerase [Planctomycetaceae bacterium]
MKLSLSVRIAEAPCKTRLNVPFGELVGLAAELGYDAVCMRASAGGVQTPRRELEQMRSAVESAGLVVSMVTADFDVPLNNDRGPDSLRDIGPSLDVAESLGCDLIRVCLKTRTDIEHARRAANAAAARGIRLAHQCHTTTLFEQVEPSLAALREIGRPNFGLIYEPANLMLCGEPYGEGTLRKFQPWLMNVYVQNHVLDPEGTVELETWCRGPLRFRHIPLWEPGGVNFEQVFAGLRAIGYTGYVTVHQAYAELMGPREAAVESARYLRGHMPGKSAGTSIVAGC